MVDKTQLLVNLAFNPKLVIGLAIFNQEYGETRKHGDKVRGAYYNIDDVEGDCVRVMQLYKQVLKIPDDNIKVLRDATHDEVDACWDDLKVKYKAAGKKAGETLFVIWYGGHGEMGGSATTQICCNSQDPRERLYPWEKQLM